MTATLECHGLGGAGAPNVALPAGATGVVAVAERLTVFEFKERKEEAVAAPPLAEPVEVEDEVEDEVLEEAVVVTPVRLIDVAAAKPEEVEDKVEDKVEEEAVVVTPVHLVDVAAE